MNIVSNVKPLNELDRLLNMKAENNELHTRESFSINALENRNTIQPRISTPNNIPENRQTFVSTTHETRSTMLPRTQTPKSNVENKPIN